MKHFLRIAIGLAVLSAFGLVSSNAGVVNQAGSGKLYTSSSSSSGGATLTDGGTFTVSGSGFGSSTASVTAFFGGKNGPVESAANGTNVTSSVNLGTGWAFSGSTPTFVSTARSLGGTRSLLNRFGYTSATGGSYNSGEFQYGFRFDVGSGGFQRGYTRVATYKTGFTNGQVKFQRFTGTLVGDISGNSGGLTDDNLPNILLNCYINGSGSAVQTHHNAALGGNGTEESNISLGANPSWVDDGWVIQEYDFTPGTAGSANGTISWRFTNAATGALLTSGSGTSSSKRFWSAGDPAYRYWIMHHFMANEAGVDGAQLNIGRDAVGVFNTSSSAFPKIVLACNNATFTSATICVPQPTISGWNNTTITGTFNQGALTGTTAGTDFWMYVMEGINDPINDSGIVPTTSLIDAANDPYAFADLELAA